MATMAVYGGTTFTSPRPSTDATNFFAYGFSSIRPTTHRLKEWVYAGSDGVSVVRFGLDYGELTMVGHVEGNSLANLESAKTTVENLLTGSPSSLTDVYGTTTYTNVIMTGLEWGRHYSLSSGRHCAEFTITFRKVQ